MELTRPHTRNFSRARTQSKRKVRKSGGGLLMMENIVNYIYIKQQWHVCQENIVLCARRGFCYYKFDAHHQCPIIIFDIMELNLVSVFICFCVPPASRSHMKFSLLCIFVYCINGWAGNHKMSVILYREGHV